MEQGTAVPRPGRGEENGKNGNEPIRVLIVEDNDFVRSGLRTIIEAAPDMVVVGEAINGRQAVELAEQLLPDTICYGPQPAGDGRSDGHPPYQPERAQLPSAGPDLLR